MIGHKLVVYTHRNMQFHCPIIGFMQTFTMLFTDLQKHDTAEL